jgi:isoquinoline 1-oxidoreductase subunit beta
MRLDRISSSRADTNSAGCAVNRRRFLKVSGAVGSVFTLGAYSGSTLAQQDPKTPPNPNAFISIDEKGFVTVMANRLDFGQGPTTALTMIAADEMDADWTKVKGVLAPAGEAYKDPMFGIQMTGGSTAIKHSWMQYRELGARTKAMLLAAAAEKLKVNVSELRASKGVITASNGKSVTYGQVAKAAMAQPIPAKISLKNANEFTIIGKPTPSLNATAKSIGSQRYGMDFKPPNAKTVLIARPPVFGATLANMDDKNARLIKGVRDVFQVNLDRGATGVAIVADGYWQAKQGRDALKLQWNTDAVEKADSAKLLAQYKALAKTPGIKTTRQDDVSKLASAPKKISAEYSFPYLAHAPMEPLNCVIDLKDSACEVWAGTQFQTIDQGSIAATLGLKPEQVKLNTLMAGGGFGRRAVPTSDYLVEAAQIAKAYKARGGASALKLVWSREDDIKGGYYRPMHVHSVEVGFDDQGNVLGWNHSIVGQSILTGTPFEGFLVKNGVDGVTVEGVADSPYNIPMAVQVHHPKVNVPVLWWRSVGHTHTAFVMETMIDEIARSSSQDPVTLRKRMLGSKHPRLVAALDMAVEKSGYGKKVLPPGRAWGVALHESFESAVAYVVEASVEKGVPKLHQATAGVHCNLAVNPLNVEAQIQGAAIMGLGTTLKGAMITLKEGVVEQSNLTDYVVPRLTDMPQISVHIVPSTEAPTGVGEPGLPPLAPAFANAIARLTGKSLRQLPFDLGTS